MATPTIETELPKYRALIPPLLYVLIIELIIVLLVLPMLLDKQFLACYIGYSIDKEIQDPKTPESVFNIKLGF